MTDVPDLRDASGRIRRLVLALTIGAICGAIAFMVTTNLALPDGARAKAGAYRFVAYMTCLAFAGAFTIALVIQNKLAKRKWQHERIPRAKIRREGTNTHT